MDLRNRIRYRFHLAFGEKVRFPLLRVWQFDSSSWIGEGLPFADRRFKTGSQRPVCLVDRRRRHALALRIGDPTLNIFTRDGRYEHGAQP
jgi:hypothetical protein